MKIKLAWIALTAVFLVPALRAGGEEQNRGEPNQAASLAAELRPVIDAIGEDLAKLNESHQKLVKAIAERENLYLQLSRKAQEVSRLALDAERSRSGDTNALFKAILEMQEMQENLKDNQGLLQALLESENKFFETVFSMIKKKGNTASELLNNSR